MLFSLCFRGFYLVQGLVLTFIATEITADYGVAAAEMQLPFGTLAVWIWIVVPIGYLAVSITAIRKRLGKWHHFLHLVAVGCIVLPMQIFFANTSRIPLTNFPNDAVYDAIEEKYHGRVRFSGTGASVSNVLNKDEVARMIFTLDPSVKPINTEHDGTE